MMERKRKFWAFGPRERGTRAGGGSGGGGGGSGGGGGGEVALGSIELFNTNASGTTPIVARFGMAWTPGTFPSGYRIGGRFVGGALDGVTVDSVALLSPNTWADGSIRSTADNGVVVRHNATLAAKGSADDSCTIALFAVPGTQATSGANPWTLISNLANDATVAITNRSGSSTGSMGNLTFSLQTAIGTTTRREVVGDTARCIRIRVWQKLSGEEHLICQNDVDLWLNASGQLEAYEFVPTLEQPWWVNNPFGATQTMQRYNYDMTVSAGGSTVDTRTGLKHHYHCRIRSLRSADDPQHAKPHWINLGLAMPTIRVRYPQETHEMLILAGSQPWLPYDKTYSGYGYGTVSTYTPGTTNGHRTGNLGQGGGYLGRAINGCTVATQLMGGRQAGSASTAEAAWRTARVAAQGMTAYFFHIRDHRPAINGGTDATKKIIPGQFRPGKVPAQDQEYPGLGAARVYWKLAKTDLDGLTDLGTFSHPHGGLGPGSDTPDTTPGTPGSYDGSHSPIGSAAMAFLEGARHLGDDALSTIVIALCCDGTTTWNRYTGDLAPWSDPYDSTVRRTTLGIPSGTIAANRYGCMPSFQVQERSAPWLMRDLAVAWTLMADNNPEQAYLRKMCLVANMFWEEGVSYLPAEASGTHRRFGGGHYVFVQPAHSPWMQAWCAPAFYWCKRVMDFLPNGAGGTNGIAKMAELSGRWAISRVQKRNVLGAYWAQANYDLHGLEYIEPTEGFMYIAGAISSDVFSIVSNGNSEISSSGMLIRNGDVLLISRGAASLNNNNPLPNGLSYGQRVYVVNAAGGGLSTTFQIAATPGGSPITGLGNHSPYALWMDLQDFSLAPNANWIGAWDGNGAAYNTLVAFETCIGEDHPDLNSTIITDARNWYDSVWNTVNTYAWHARGF